MKVVAYVRVSTKEQSEEGYSIPAQVELIEQYCKQHAYTIEKLFRDVDSGGKNDRKGFQAMVAHGRFGHWVRVADGVQLG